MRDVQHKVPLLLESGVQARQHGVEGVRQLLNLYRAVPCADPPAQV